MSHLSRRFAIALLSCAAAMPAALHAETPAPMAGKPEDVGLSSAQLRRLEAATKQNIDDGLMPGAVMLVARHGKVAWISVQGKRAPDSYLAPSLTAKRGVIGSPLGRGPGWAARATLSADTWKPESTMPSGLKTRALKASPKVLPSITSTSLPCTSTDTPYSQRAPGWNFSGNAESFETNWALVSARSPILASI